MLKIMIMNPELKELMEEYHVVSPEELVGKIQTVSRLNLWMGK